MLRLSMGAASGVLVLACALFMLGVSGGLAAECVVASWYGPGFHGNRTASGERFDQNAMTAAHKSLPFGTKLRVTYRGRSVVVRTNDRGPYTRGRDLDLSKAAAAKIGLIPAGVGRVCVDILR